MAWHGMAWHGIVWYDGMAWYGMVWYGTKLISKLMLSFKSVSEYLKPRTSTLSNPVMFSN